MTGVKGMKMSAETRRKMSLYRTGRPRTQETKDKLKLHYSTPEARERMRIQGLGRRPTEETRKKLSDYQQSRPPATLESRLKMSLAHKGHANTPESNARRSKSQIGKEKHTLEFKMRTSERMSGKSNWNWQGGKSFEPYCVKFNKGFKRRVRTFFGYKCVECGVEQIKPALCIHHVNFDKSSCCSEVKPLFVPLCRKCHSRTNFNRGYWEERYTMLINEKYGGECYVVAPRVKDV